LKLKAYAKINLSLKVLAKRPDGYHEIESIMQSVSLYDLVSLETVSSGVHLTTNTSQLTNDNKNLAYKAAKTILERTGQKQGVRIKLEKNIPLASGLAGGSADAAAVLVGMNKMLGNKLSEKELLDLGASIGSDVPFCLVGGAGMIKGRGEIVERSEGIGVSRYYVLVTPPVEVSSKWAYEAWDKMFEVPSSKLNTSSNNDLEAIVIKKYPVIGEVKKKLLQLGCAFVQMSGSGSSVFGVVDRPQTGEKITTAMKKEYPNSFLVEKVDRGVEETD